MIYWKHCTQGAALLAGLALLTAGCTHGKKSSINARLREASQKAQQGDDHAQAGPHGGVLAEWGDDEYHAEFIVDHEKKEARVYVLGKDAKTPAPIKAKSVLLSVKRPPFQIELKPEKQKGDPDGTASVFVGTHEHLAKERDYEGTLSAEFDGKQYSGDFKGHGHSHKEK